MDINKILKATFLFNQQLTCCHYNDACWLAELQYHSVFYCRCTRCSLQQQQKVQAQQFCSAVVTSSSSHQCSEGSSCSSCSTSTEAACMHPKTGAASAGGAVLKLHLPAETLHVRQCSATADCSMLHCLTACCCNVCCLLGSQDWQHLPSTHLLQLGWLGRGTHLLWHTSHCR